MKKTLKIIGNILFVILIIIGVLLAFPLLPIKNNYKILAVTSGSMKPAINVGSLAIVKPVSVYSVGDIITFQSGSEQSQTTTHRIQEIEESANGQKIYTTKGDANKEADLNKVEENKILGKVFFSIKYLGYLLGYIKTLPGLILIIIIPATIIIYEELKNVRKEAIELVRKKTDRKKNNKEKIKSKGKDD